MAAHPPRGVIRIAALDLRRRPDHKSELISQLLLGEEVRVLAVSPDGRWWRVENRVDLYRGWIRTWGVVGLSGREAAAWDRAARGRVRVSYTEMVSKRSGGTLVSPLFWRSRLILEAGRGSRRAARLPDGRRGWVAIDAIATSDRPRTSLEERIRSLLGVPYLWGGRTPLGLDCSALTQLLFAEQGVRLPRDADQQFHACSLLPEGRAPRRGDLLFFGRPRGRLGHVALALGSGAYVHARGWVRINSLESGNALYDSELSAQLRGVGRARKRAIAGAAWPPGPGDVT